MDSEAKMHEAKVELDLGFDHIFELGDHPETFKQFLEVFGDSLGDAGRWIQEKYGAAAAETWARIYEAVQRAKANHRE